MAIQLYDKLIGLIPTDILSLALFALLPLGLWLYTALLSSIAFPTIRNSHILLLIAHPDDEAMFFSPTLLNLTRPSLNNTVKILCLSNGNADGLGATRKQELLASAKLLGIDPRYVVCIDDPALQDSMTASWPTPTITAMLARYLLPSDYTLPILSPTDATTTSIFKPSPPPQTTTPRPSKTTPSTTAASHPTAPPALHSDVLLTFDAAGVSAHPNHTSLYHGAKAFLTALRAAHPGWTCPLTVYALRTVSLPRKYASALDVPASVLAGVLTVAARTFVDGWRGRGRGRGRGSAGKADARAGLPTWLLYVSGFGALRTGQRAMYTAHRSQMRWFRWGWIGLGRYMVVNDLRQVE